jgi:hypothetical protein
MLRETRLNSSEPGSYKLNEPAASHNESSLAYTRNEFDRLSYRYRPDHEDARLMENNPRETT